jgi:uncharacterized tellurite resistance protein B-like protein
MIRSVREFVRKHFSANDDADATATGIPLAVAALLVEILRADFETSADERRRLLESLQRLLGLEEQACEELFALAEQHIDQSHDLYQFTSEINRSWAPDQKLRLLEELWRVAQADEQLHKYEEHLIRRIADLLHVPHSGFIAAKLRSRADMT